MAYTLQGILENQANSRLIVETENPCHGLYSGVGSRWKPCSRYSSEDARSVAGATPGKGLHPTPRREGEGRMREPLSDKIMRSEREPVVERDEGAPVEREVRLDAAQSPE